MPYSRPGDRIPVVNDFGAALDHAKPCVVADGTLVGVAIKQQALPWDAGLSGAQEIAEDEAFVLIRKGVVQCAIASVAVGDPIYIDPDDNSITKTPTNNLKFGRVVEDENQRGTPAGHARIDLDDKNF